MMGSSRLAAWRATATVSRPRLKQPERPRTIKRPRTITSANCRTSAFIHAALEPTVSLARKIFVTAGGMRPANPCGAEA
jgi:hypothetical protein